MDIRRIGYALLLLGLPTFGWPQIAATSPVGVAHVALRVNDVDGEVNFLKKLGFEQSFAKAESGQTLQAFIKINDRQFIEVYPSTAVGEAPGPLGLMHVCYEVADLKAMNDRYALRGLKPTSYRTAEEGNLLFNLQDPDGRLTEFTQYVPGSRQMDDMGQHLGGMRISDELTGFEMPVKDLKTAQKFYETLGFDAVKEGPKVRLSLAPNPDVQIVLHQAREGDRPQFFLSVDDARRTEDQLRDAGLNAVREKNQVSVRDTEGNVFVLYETSEKRPRRLVPWKK